MAMVYGPFLVLKPAQFLSFPDHLDETDRDHKLAQKLCS